MWHEQPAVYSQQFTYQNEEISHIFTHFMHWEPKWITEQFLLDSYKTRELTQHCHTFDIYFDMNTASHCKGYMADYESSGQQDVPQYGGDETVKVWSFDLQPEETSLSNRFHQCTKDPNTGEVLNLCMCCLMCCCALTYSSKPSPTTEKWPMWYGQNARKKHRG